MELAAAAVNALIAALCGALAGFWAGRSTARRSTVSTSQPAKPDRAAPPNGADDTGDQQPASGEEPGGRESPGVPEKPDRLRALSATLERQREDWQTLLAAQSEKLLHTHREQIERLQRDLQRQQVHWRREVERLESLLRADSSRQIALVGRDNPQGGRDVNSIGVLALEVNGLVKEYAVVANARMTLGRGAGNDIVLQDMRLSEVHVAFRSDAKQTFVEPLGAANPVLLNERRLAKATALRGGDVLTFGGNCRLTFTRPMDEQTAA